VSEALALQQKDMDRARGTIIVLHGKGDRTRVVGLDAEAWGYIDAWEQVRRGLGYRAGLLFMTRSGRPVLPSYMRGLVPRLARRAGIERRVHPHALRRAFAFELAERGVPIPVISQALGHSSVATTAKYLTAIRPESVLQAIAERPSWDTE
jgi:integrase/recombinase XerD